MNRSEAKLFNITEVCCCISWTGTKIMWESNFLKHNFNLNPKADKIICGVANQAYKQWLCNQRTHTHVKMYHLYASMLVRWGENLVNCSKCVCFYIIIGFCEFPEMSNQWCITYKQLNPKKHDTLTLTQLGLIKSENGFLNSVMIFSFLALNCFFNCASRAYSSASWWTTGKKKRSFLLLLKSVTVTLEL